MAVAWLKTHHISYELKGKASIFNLPPVSTSFGVEFIHTVLEHALILHWLQCDSLVWATQTVKVISPKRLVRVSVIFLIFN